MWNERNPKKISSKYIPNDELVTSPAHKTISEIKQLKVDEHRKNANLEIVPTDYRVMDKDP